jgi:S1-C subfamily serine protease
MPRSILKIIGFFAIGMVGGIFADQVAWPYLVEKPLFEKYGYQQPVYLTERKEIYIQENIALQDAVSKVENTVITLKTKLKSGNTIEGSGLIISSDGLIVTLAELVPQGSEFSFYFENNLVSYQILKRDLEENLALVKIDKTALPTAGFSDTAKIKLGQRVFLLGNLLDKDGTFTRSVAEGIISSMNESYFLTDIADSENMKGSALFDIEGKLIGVNTINKDGRVITISIDKIKKFAGF